MGIETYLIVRREQILVKMLASSCSKHYQLSVYNTTLYAWFNLDPDSMSSTNYYVRGTSITTVEIETIGYGGILSLEARKIGAESCLIITTEGEQHGSLRFYNPIKNNLISRIRYAKID